MIRPMSFRTYASASTNSVRRSSVQARAAFGSTPVVDPFYLNKWITFFNGMTLSNIHQIWVL